MTTSHQFTEPTDWPAPWHVADLGDSIEYLVRETEDVASLPGKFLVQHEKALTAAREKLNDALAKIDAENEGPPPLAPIPLFERIH